MGLLSRIKNKMPAPALDVVEVASTYPSMDRFKGTKRLNVSSYGDKQNGMENAVRILGDADRHDCTGTEITLTSFEADSNKGIRVAVDGEHIGIAWDSANDELVFSAAYSGRIAGVFVRIERVPIDDSAKVSLFVLLKK